MKNICSLELSKILKENGFNDICTTAYVKEYGVRDSIMEKYPGLSDCGYQDLTKRYGGKYNESEVYEHRIVLVKTSCCDNARLEEINQIASAPHIYEAKKWVENKFGCKVIVDYNFSNEKYYSFIAFDSCDVARYNFKLIKDKNFDSVYIHNTEGESLEEALINFLKEKKNGNKIF